MFGHLHPHQIGALASGNLATIIKPQGASRVGRYKADSLRQRNILHHFRQKNADCIMLAGI